MSLAGLQSGVRGSESKADSEGIQQRFPGAAKTLRTTDCGGVISGESNTKRKWGEAVRLSSRMSCETVIAVIICEPQSENIAFFT